MSLKKELGLAVVANWTGTVCSYLLAFIATPIIVHSFGNERYGIWSIAMSLTGYYGILDIGIRTTIIKYFADYSGQKEYKKANILLNTTLASYSFIIPIIAVVVILLVLNIEKVFNIDPVFLKETQVVFCIVGLNFCVGAIGNTFRGVIVSQRKFVLRNTVNVIFSILRSLTIIFILKMGHGLVVAALSVLAVELVSALTLICVVFKICPFLKFSRSLIDFESMKGAYVFAFFNFLRQMSIRILERTDILLVGIFLDMKTVAFYSIAESLLRYLAKIPKGVRATILPFTSKLKTENKEKGLKAIAMIMPKYTMSFLLGTALMAVLFGRQFIAFWMGPNYDLSWEILIILLFAKTFSMSQSMLIHVVVGLGHNRFYGFLGLIEMFLNLGLSIVLVKTYGVYGIAFASLITVVLTSGLITPIYSLKKIALKTSDYFLKVMVGPIALFVLLYAVNGLYLKVENILWIPVIGLEFVLFSFLFVWKELRFRNGKLKLVL